MSRAIEVRDYSFCYANSEQAVLKHCAMQFDYGEFVVLGGHSGSGKSTLLAALIGRIPHLLPGEQSGEIVLYPPTAPCGSAAEAAAHSIAGRTIAELAHSIGSVLQDADSQIIHAVVADEVAFGCENLNMEPALIEQRATSACAMMELERTAFTNSLSGGQKQRLVTATTLAMGQRILVFDEPLANLDRKAAHLLMGHLKELARAGYAVLLVEHRLDVVAPFADRILWLEDGRIVPATGVKGTYLLTPFDTRCLSSQTKGVNRNVPVRHEGVLLHKEGESHAV
jgi:energy-coupling factor transport system ATP-binding protein